MMIEFENCTTTIKGVTTNNPSNVAVNTDEINLVQKYGGRTAIEMKNGTVIITSTEYNQVLQLIEDSVKTFMGFDLANLNSINPEFFKPVKTKPV